MCREERLIKDTPPLLPFPHPDCVWRSASNQISFRIISLSVPYASPSSFYFFLPYFRISSKYRQRRLIPRLSVSHSHTGSQVCARLMRHMACAGKKEEEGEEEGGEGAYLQVSLKANHKFWGEKLKRGRESQFRAKGASGSLKMDPHPLLMPSLPCLFRLPHEQHAEREEETCTKVLYPSILFVLFPPQGGLPLWCQRRGHLPFGPQSYLDGGCWFAKQLSVQVFE